MLQQTLCPHRVRGLVLVNFSLQRSDWTTWLLGKVYTHTHTRACACGYYYYGYQMAVWQLRGSGKKREGLPHLVLSTLTHHSIGPVS